MYEIMRINTMRTINYNPSNIEIYRKTETKTDSGGIIKNYNLSGTATIRLYDKETKLVDNETGEKRIYNTKAICKYDIDIQEGDKIKDVLNNKEYLIKIILPYKRQAKIIKYELVLEEV